MKMIDLKRVKLHDTIFVAKTNLSQHIDIERRRDVKLTYSPTEEMLYVELNGEVELVPRENISGMSPIDSKPFLAKVAEESQTKPLRATAREPEPTPVQKARVKAQVSDPVRDPVYGQGN